VVAERHQQRLEGKAPRERYVLRFIDHSGAVR